MYSKLPLRRKRSDIPIGVFEDISTLFTKRKDTFDHRGAFNEISAVLHFVCPTLSAIIPIWATIKCITQAGIK